MSEMWAALAGIVVYALFRCAAFGTQYINALMPLNDKTPSLFLEAILSWGGAISAAATFVVVVSCLSAVFKSKFRTISQQRKERNK